MSGSNALYLIVDSLMLITSECFNTCTAVSTSQVVNIGAMNAAVLRSLAAQSVVAALTALMLATTTAMQTITAMALLCDVGQ